MTSLSSPPRLNASLALLGFLLTSLLPLSGALAFGTDAFRITPGIAARELYDSNVYLMGKGDMEHSIAPSLKVEANDDRYQAWIKGTGTVYKYTKLNEFDRFDHNYDALFSVNATEKLTLSLTGASKFDHTFSETLNETGQLAKQVARTYYSAQPNISYQLTERNLVSVYAAYVKTTYDSSGTTDYTDSTTNVFGGQWGYSFTERLQAIAQVSRARTTVTNGFQNVINTMGGFEYALAETIKARVLVGRSSYNSENQGRANSASGLSSDTSLEWRGEAHMMKAFAGRDVTSGLNGEDIVRTRFGFYGERNITERFMFRVHCNVVNSKKEGANVLEETTRWLELTPSLAYQTTEYSTLSLGYSYGARTVKETEESKRRNQLYLSFNITLP